VGQAARRPRLAYVLVQEDGELGGPVAKNLTDEERAGLAAHVGAQPGDCVFFAAGAVKSSRALLGAAASRSAAAAA
jgi:aspartyl-tRNA synthetase